LREKGLRFPCPYPQDGGKQFSDFLTAPRDLIYNPWPETVDLDYRAYPWTQPILRLEYGAAIKPYGASPPNSAQSISKIHEWIHSYLNFTPAKHYMRIGLGETFEYIRNLLAPATRSFRPMPDKPGSYYLGDLTQRDRELFVFNVPKHLEHEFELAISPQRKVNAILEHNELMAEHCTKIMLAEELIATTCSFQDAELKIADLGDSAHKQSEFRTLECDWRARQTAVLDRLSKGLGDKFQELYDPFKKAARLLQEYYEPNRQPWSGLPKLARFLEPISIEGKQIEVIDCTDRCYDLAIALFKIETGEELVKWLDKSLARTVESRSLRLLREMLLDEDWKEDEQRELITYLYAFATGSWPQMDSPDKFVRWILGQYYKMPHPSEDRRLCARFFPEYADGRWYIKTLIPYREDDLWSDYCYFLTLEALRQQFNMREGFWCPLMCIVQDSHSTCVCETDYPSVKAQLVKMISLARDGALGDGNWRDLPYPCGPVA
jgi:hypothetical protein